MKSGLVFCLKTIFKKLVRKFYNKKQTRVANNAEPLFGCMASNMKIIGDIVEPTGIEDWEALK